MTIHARDHRHLARVGVLLATALLALTTGAASALADGSDGASPQQATPEGDAAGDGSTAADPHGGAWVACSFSGGQYTATGSGYIQDAINQQLTVQVRALYDFPTGTSWVVLSQSSTTTPDPHWGHYETSTSTGSQSGYYSWQGRAIMTGTRQSVPEQYNAYDAC